MCVQKKRKTYSWGPTCWRADMDGGGPWMRVDAGVHASGRVAKGGGGHSVWTQMGDVDALTCGCVACGRGSA